MNCQGVSIPHTGPSVKPDTRIRNGVLLVLIFLIATSIWLGIRGAQGGFKLDVFLATFRNMNLAWFGASIVLVLGTYLGRAVRWQVMLRPLRADSHLWNLFKATAVGFTAVVLFGRAGELVRPYLIAVKEKVPFTSQLATWFLERLYDLLMVLLLFGFALSQISRSSTQVGPSMQWILQAGGNLAGFLATVALALLIVFGMFPNFVETRLIQALAILPARFRLRIEGLVRAFLSGTSSTRRASFVLLLVTYTFCEWLIIVACFLCVFRAFPETVNLGLVDTLIVVGFVAFGSAVQIPGVGGGMQVATVLVLTELFHVQLEAATGIAILLWIVTFVSVVPFGLVLAVHDGLKWRNLLNTEEMKSA
jgi:uncharacterized membrane protein YbhN (UPF0104 family)